MPEQNEKDYILNLLLVLCCFDILFLLSYGSVRVYDAFSCNPADYSNNELLPMGKVFAWPLLEIGWLGSIYMTVAISLERYVGICRPNLLLSRRAFLFIIPVVLISFGFSFPRFLEYELIFLNGTMVGKGKGQGINSNEEFGEYNQAYHLWASVFFKQIFPIAALFSLNGATMATIYKTSKATKHLRKTRSKHRRNTTKILFWIVLIFLILHSFPLAFRYLYFLGPEDMTTWYWVSPIAHLAAVTNSSINFLIYCMVGKSFRAQIIKILGCTRKVKNCDTEEIEEDDTGEVKLTSMKCSI